MSNKISNSNSGKGSRSAPAKSITKKPHCVHISNACSEYCQAICDPFHAKPCGVPTYPALPTYKYEVFSRGQSYTGTQGVGFVGINPRALYANDREGIRYSTALFDNDSMQNGGTGVLTTSGNSPFDANAGANAITRFRLVACGLRVRYGGTELERGGFKIGIVDPTHDSLTGRTAASLLEEKQAKRFKVQREWSTALWRPVLSEELEFEGSGGMPAGTNPSMGFLFVSPNGTNIMFEWEVVAFFEAQGVNARGQTHTMPDPIGFGAVQAGMNHMDGVTNKSTKQTHESMMSKVIHYLEEGVSRAESFIEGAGRLYTAGKTIYKVGKPVAEALELIGA